LQVADAVNEIRVLASVRHPHIVSFLQAFLDKGDKELCVIMEYCGCGDLAQKVDRYKKRKQTIDERVIWAYLIQVLCAWRVACVVCARGLAWRRKKGGLVI